MLCGRRYTEDVSRRTSRRDVTRRTLLGCYAEDVARMLHGGRCTKDVLCVAPSQRPPRNILRTTSSAQHPCNVRASPPRNILVVTPLRNALSNRICSLETLYVIPCSFTQRSATISDSFATFRFGARRYIVGCLTGGTDSVAILERTCIYGLLYDERVCSGLVNLYMENMKTAT